LFWILLLYNRLPSYLDKGEREAIVLFIEIDGDVLLMDDGDGRRIARAFIKK
jgi:predicted nucleic acid-binding protein